MNYLFSNFNVCAQEQDGVYECVCAIVCVCVRVWMKRQSQGKYFKTFYLSLDAEKQQAAGVKEERSQK